MASRYEPGAKIRWKLQPWPFDVTDASIPIRMAMGGEKASSCVGKMTRCTVARAVVTKAEIREWVITWLVRETAVDRAEIESASSFAELGISSRQAVMLSADLEGLLERDLAPNLLWKFPSLDELVEHLE